MSTGPALPRVATTPVPGLLTLALDLRGDARGFFKENWQRVKMVAAGLPDFEPVQQNISYNATRGVLRGLHAEPWDKLVSVATGRVFGAWVDLREGPSFGTVFTHEIGPGDAVFVPRGVANGFQVLEDGTAYAYLVNDHWNPDVRYVEVSALDRSLGITWPVSPDSESVEMSAKDRANPPLSEVSPVPARRPLEERSVLVLGSGQVATAFLAALPRATQATRADLDLADPAAVARFDLSSYDVVVNAAAHTQVDAAETPEGRRAAWAVNATAPGLLARGVAAHGGTLVHFSTDYVFDGTREEHTEEEPVAPLGGYGQSKAAGELAVAAAPRHLLLRTSWVIGDGANFVRTMQRLAADGVSPSVVQDQVGRLTFTAELVRATRHLLDVGAAPGTYHLTNGGTPRSWADYARTVFAAAGRDPADVTGISTEQYAEQQRTAGRSLAPRPRHSTLSLDKVRATGFEPADADQALADHLGDTQETGGTPRAT